MLPQAWSTRARIKRNVSYGGIYEYLCTSRLFVQRGLSNRFEALYVRICF